MVLILAAVHFLFSLLGMILRVAGWRREMQPIDGGLQGAAFRIALF